MEGIVYKSTGSFYQVKDDAGEVWSCRIRGKFKIDDEISSTNPIAVGDKIVFDIDEAHEQAGWIGAIQPRDNYMVRVSPHNRNQQHIVASNIGQAALIATVKEPRTSYGFIDRFLITAEAYHIPAIIVFNKSDLLKGKSRDEWERKKQVYENVGYDTFTLSAIDTNTLRHFEERLKNTVTLFSGHSGVGKSTLINRLIPGKGLKVGEVSGWSGKGQHTTTFAEMMDLPFGGSIIDTPGVKEFGIVDMTPEELSHYFPEMRKYIGACKFNNCIHINEPDCAVKAALAEGSVSEERYGSYLSILESIG